MLHQTNRLSLQSSHKILCILTVHLLLTHSCRASGAVCSPVISLAGIERGGVVLQCESKGWHPQPEMFWLDGEGKPLSAEPTETVRGPDGLYTVSSRVTVEKSHSNNFTCRVQQKDINQIRETHIIVPEDFFQIQPSSSAIIRLAVTLIVCIVFTVAVFFFGWKWRQSMINTKSCWDETEGGGNKSLSKSDDPEMHPLNVIDTDGETFTVTTAVSEENKRKKEKKNKRVENKQAECDLMKLQQLHEENQRRERDLQTLKDNLEIKTKELEKINADWSPFSDEEEQQRKEQTEKEVETLKKELQTKQEEFETKTKELDRKQTNADKLLQKEKQNREEEVKDLKNQLYLKQKELETIIDNWSPFSDEEEQQRKEQTEKEVETLKKELQTKQEEFETKTKELDRKQTNADRLLQEEKQKREEEVKDLKNQLESKQKQVEHKQAECDLTELQQPHEENQRRQRELQTLKENLETKTKELETIIDNWSPFSDEEEQQRKEQTEKEVETLKKELQTKQEEFETKTKERPEASQHNDTNLADQNSTEIFVEVDPNGKYIRLTNESKEDLKLEGWKLRVKVNDENPIMYTFKKSFKLRAEKSVRIWVPGWDLHLPPYNLTWKDLKRWVKGDKLLIELINCHEEIVKTTEV